MQQAVPSPPVVERTEGAFTVRALITGLVLAAGLSLCNIYSGLKIGWGFNMSITSALLAFAFWNALAAVGISRPIGLHENMVNQTGASAGANISSAGLVAPIPALAYLTGQTLDFGWLALWTLTVSWVGVVVGMGLRRPMIVEDDLPFPNGVAISETVREMYARGEEAVARVIALLSGAVVAGLTKLSVAIFNLPKLAIPGSFTLANGTPVSLYNLTFALDPSFFLFAVGFIAKPKVGFSMLLGAIVGFGLLAPRAISRGFVEAGAPDRSWFLNVNEYLLWPGVALMVTSALTSFALMIPMLLRALKTRRGEGEDDGDVSSATFWRALIAVGVLSVALQIYLFSISTYAAAIGIILTFLLAVVAGRVSGETGITPVGPMGKVTQLAFGVIAPANPTANLMAANVTGGAASQVGDMLHDLKAGRILGSRPRHQFGAQAVGVIGGALAGSAAYLVVLPDPKGMLFTEQWPAPAAAQWRGVAELLSEGLAALPSGALTVAIIAGALGVVLSLLERLAPEPLARYVPSSVAVGLAMVIPAYYAVSLFIGTVTFLVIRRLVPRWTERFAVVVASGLIAGESLMGISVALYRIL